jgi:hypothetical protein
MRSPRRDDLLDAALAALAAGVHLAMAAVVDRFPPSFDFSVVFVVLPVLAAAVAAVALLVARERRPLQAACLYGWLVVLFTLPAQGLGFAWIPSALVLTAALARPRLSQGALSSDREAAG